MVVVLGLLLRVALIRMPSVLASRHSESARERALLAARSGADYAVARLREDPFWQGGDGRAVVVEQAGLRVTEENGSVTGTLKHSDGSSSKFRLTFAGSTASEEERPDAAYLSVNNLVSDVPVPMPKTNRLKGLKQDIPANSAYLLVEGEGGEGRAHGGRSRVVEAVYRLAPDGGVKDAVIMAGGDLSFQVGADSGQVFLSGTHVNRADSDVLRLRSKSRIGVARAGQGLGPINVQDRVRAELTGKGPAQAKFDTEKVSTADETVGDGEDFYNLRWDQIPKAENGRRSRTSVQIPGGVYVYGQKVPIDSTPRESREIRYYDMSFQQYTQRAESLANNPNQGVVLSADLQEIRNNTNERLNPKGIAVKPALLRSVPPGAQKAETYDGFRFQVENTNLLIEPSAQGREDFVLIPRDPAKFDRRDGTNFPQSNDRYNPDHMSVSLDDAILTAKGDVIIQGGVNGRGGTIVSEGDISLLAGKSLDFVSEARTEADLENDYRELLAMLGEGEVLGESSIEPSSLQLNLYSKGDLRLSTYVERTDAYRSLAFKGLLYSWGDVGILAGRGSEPSRGNFALQGALVAYGNDPESEEPGANGKGNITVRARNASLAWDPRYLPSLSALQPEGKTFLTLKRSHYREVR